MTKKERKAQVKAERKARKENEKASEEFVKDSTRGMTKEQRRELHDSKKAGEGDRSRQQIQEDIEDVKKLDR